MQQTNGVTFALYGKSGSGKSYLIRHLFIEKLYAKGSPGQIADDKKYLITVPTESPDSDQFRKMPPDVLIDGFGLDVDIVNWAFQMNQTHDKRYNFVFLFDDCIHMKHTKAVERLFLIMRNTNITSAVSIQYPKLIQKSVRTSVFFTFCMHFSSSEGAEVVITDYLERYLPGKNMKEKVNYYLDWTVDHQFFLIDNLNHKVYQVNNRHFCYEMPIIDDSNDVDTKSTSSVRS